MIGIKIKTDRHMILPSLERNRDLDVEMDYGQR